LEKDNKDQQQIIAEICTTLTQSSQLHKLVTILVILHLKSQIHSSTLNKLTYHFQKSPAQSVLPGKVGEALEDVKFSWTVNEAGNQLQTILKWEYGQFIPPNIDFVDYFTRSSSLTLRNHIYQVLKIDKQIQAIADSKDFKGSINKFFRNVNALRVEDDKYKKNFFLFSKAKLEADELFLKLRWAILRWRHWDNSQHQLDFYEVHVRNVVRELADYIVKSFVYLNDVYVMARFFRNFIPKEKDVQPFAGGIKRAVFYFGDTHSTNYASFLIDAGYKMVEHSYSKHACVENVPAWIDFHSMK
jgi:hypothetical protein